ncbi:Enolase, N-terminal [Parasponia andersonii]|uniref:Enolase, N-terminal n=1 Tax=Parasponia andersonii TaxID=3476 RepID=A0A2P5BAB2_PARAD|nr:Enolase, N-terminal [Parasponia andersonii]
MASSGAADVKEMDPTELAAIDKLITQVLAKKCSEHCGQGPMKKVTYNLILAVSLAVCKAGATIKNKPLYKVYPSSYGILDATVKRMIFSSHFDSEKRLQFIGLIDIS